MTDPYKLALGVLKLIIDLPVHEKDGPNKLHLNGQTFQGPDVDWFFKVLRELKNICAQPLAALEKLDADPVAWRYRFVTTAEWVKERAWSDWFIVDAPTDIPYRDPDSQQVQPLYLAPPVPQDVNAELVEAADDCLGRWLAAFPDSKDYDPLKRLAAALSRAKEAPAQPVHFFRNDDEDPAEYERGCQEAGKRIDAELQAERDQQIRDQAFEDAAKIAELKHRTSGMRGNWAMAGNQIADALRARIGSPAGEEG